MLFCQASDAGPFLKGAFEAGIGGPGYLWFGSDAVTKSDTWLNDDVLLDETLRLQVMQGFFGMTPSTGKGTAPYEAYLARLRAMPPTTGSGGSCNLQAARRPPPAPSASAARARPLMASRDACGASAGG